jgi:cell division protease FtsH
MDEEERFLDAVDDTEDEDMPAATSWRERKRRRLRGRNQVAIDEFLGEGRRTSAVGILPRYYCELFTWALHRYLEKQGWMTVSMLGYHGPEPVYIDVNTGDEKKNLLMDGQLLIEKDDSRFIVTVDVNPRCNGSVQIEGLEQKKEEVGAFVSGVMTIAEKENFYRGKKVEFNGRIRFLDVQDKSWDSIVMDAEAKAEIKANTVGFLKHTEQWSKYGIPLKRGILLAGEPGTGKTIICKALMAAADEITCITTNGYALDDDDYISELYELADDLSPSIVFIEDIDLIGQNRMEFGYQRGPALLSLLAILDGVEEQKKIVTVATTNCLETLDKALSQRPSRFDRVIKLSRPGQEQRRELINRLCERIPLDESTRDYIAHRSEGCTPAQLQEIVYNLVIQCPAGQSELCYSKTDIDRAISRINDKNRHQIGFDISGNHNGHRVGYIEATR